MAVKKPVTKTARVAAKKKTTSRPAATTRLKSISAKQTKTQIIAAITEETGLAKKDVVAVFGSLGNLVKRHMQKRGSGEFAIPETGVKIRRVRKPATKARMGRNPATGETIKIAAKPARTVVRVTALKALKDTVL